MSSRFLILTTTLMALLLCRGVSPILAQSLGDVARKEEARRKEIRQPAKTYTNKDLGDIPPPPSEAPVENAKASEPAHASPDDKSTAATDTTVIKKDQAYWSGRQKTLLAQLETDQTFADAMQTKINALKTDVSARSDPAQRVLLERDLKKALEELDRLKKSIQNDKKSISDFQEEARRAGVSPGWLR
jgi:hypothetical protein